MLTIFWSIHIKALYMFWGSKLADIGYVNLVKDHPVKAYTLSNNCYKHNCYLWDKTQLFYPTEDGGTC